MAKKIDRSRIEAGRFDLPKKLAFLLEDKVDFNSIADRDGEWTVELPLSALQKLVRSKAQLKALKAEHKLAAGTQADAQAAAEAEHGSTRAALAKAEQRIRALEKKLAAAAAAAATAAAAPPAAAPTAPSAKPARKPKAVPRVTYPHAAQVAAPVEEAGRADPAAPAEAPAEVATDVPVKVPPRKLSTRKPTVASEPPVALATAVDVVQAAAAGQGDEAGAEPPPALTADTPTPGLGD